MGSCSATVCTLTKRLVPSATPEENNRHDFTNAIGVVGYVPQSSRIAWFCIERAKDLRARYVCEALTCAKMLYSNCDITAQIQSARGMYALEPDLVIAISVMTFNLADALCRTSCTCSDTTSLGFRVTPKYLAGGSD